MREFFVGEPEIEIGTIIRAYRLENGRYQLIPLENEGYHSQVLNQRLPKLWEI